MLMLFFRAIKRKGGRTMDFGIASVAAIVAICYFIGLGVKASGIDNKWITVIVAAIGGILGVV